ncbi:alpha/beta fold hydrolase [Agromyces sp. NPDC058484]|uniref:alpha/beta fold hydrolase n=1 Tax=Agromyces sp. NPDC058484 TaxID=3346524 RepID=UPI0036643265
MARRVLTGSVVGLFAACLAGYAAQSSAVRRDALRYPPPGRLVDAGGFRLHLDVRGEPRGAPTVVLEAGLGSFSPNWHWVQTALADRVRVVAYDRAGLGWSDPSRAPRDAATMAKELRGALNAADIDGPFVLAGHSFGGLVVRAFAELFRAETAGLVLVDASHPDQWARWPVPQSHRIQFVSLGVSIAAARIGLFRVVDPFGAVTEGLPERQAAELHAGFVRPSTPVTEAAQMREWERSTRPFLHRAAPLGELPLAVIGVGVQPMGAETLTALQEELPSLSTNSARRVITGATHESLIADRAHATQVATAILAVIDAGGGDRVSAAWSARSQSGSDVGGHGKLPIGGHENCPWMASRVARWWP